MYRLPAPIRFVFRFVPEVGHGERAFVDTQVGAIHARHYTGLVAVSGEFIDLYEKRSGQW